jgi:transposase InsO family protein
VADVRQQLRRAFARWGRPATIRVDNGGPWGSAGDWPPDLALWLIGLGITVHWNDPYRPQQNGIVERSQGTGRRWAEPGQCATVAELQRRLHQADVIQREAYPSIDGQSRAAAFPGLRHSGRPYQPAWERRHWDHRRVLEHLAGYVVPRRVDKNGDVSLYHRPHYVGSMHRGKALYVMVDPQRVEWVFVDRDGRQLRSQPADELHARRIRGLTVTNRR